MAMINTDAGSLTVLLLESSKNYGGQERRLIHEAKLLRERGHVPLVACPADADLFERAVEAGIEAFAVPMRNGGQPSSVFQLCSVVRRQSVDVLYSHSSKDSTLAGIVSLLTSRPLIRSRELLNPIKKAMSYNFLSKRILACSDAVRDHLISAGVSPAKVHIQYPPVATKRFKSCTEEERLRTRKELELEGHYPVITCIAGFRVEKRQEDLIRAMVTIRQTYPTARLVLAGSGWYVNNLREIANELGVADLLDCPGEREDVPALLANTDVFVLPSSMEPFGMSPVEAMAAGVPVVVTRTGGLAEIVTDGVDGLLVPVENPEGIAAAVVRICQDPELRERLSCAGRQRATDFDEAKAVDSLIKHFRDVLQPTRAQ